MSNIMRQLAGAGEFEAHPTVANAGSFDRDILGRSGFFFYDDANTGDTKELFLPNLGETQQCVGFIRNTGTSNVTIKSLEAATLSMTLSQNEAGIVMWHSDGKWVGSAVLKSGTVT